MVKHLASDSFQNLRSLAIEILRALFNSSLLMGPEAVELKYEMLVILFMQSLGSIRIKEDYPYMFHGPTERRPGRKIR